MARIADRCGYAVLAILGAIAGLLVLDLFLWFVVNDAAALGHQIDAKMGRRPVPRGGGRRRPPTLYEAAKRNDVDAVAAFLEAGADPNEADSVGPLGFIYSETALWTAADRGHTDVVQALLAAGADPNVVGSRYLVGAFARSTSLHAAANRGDRDRTSPVGALLGAGADANAGSGYFFGAIAEETPLDVALYRAARAKRSPGQSATVRALREAGGAATGGSEEDEL